MATIKYKEASPYSKPIPRPPAEDYLYKNYESDFACSNDGSNEKIIGIALFGVGRAGTIHLSNIIGSKRAKLLYIIDDIEEKWSKIKNHYCLNNVTFLTSKQSDKVFQDKAVDAVVVASPTYTHEKIVLKSLDAKKAVFCEKPIAEDRANTEKCFEAARKSGKALFTAFNRRFDPSYSKVRDEVRQGKIGHVQVVKTVSRDSPIPTIDYLKNSGGIFHDCMVHDIDLITWLIGELPSKVSVQAAANIPEIKAIDDFDTVAVTMQFPSGTLGIIDLSRNSCYGYDMRLEAFGPKGVVRAENEQPIHCVETMYKYNGPNHSPIWYSFASRFKLAYMREFDHFIDIVLGKSICSVEAKEVLAVSKIATACEESARSGKMITLNWTTNEIPNNHLVQ